MSFEEFEKNVTVIQGKPMRDLRERYISTFINEDMEHYKKYILNLTLCSDGFCYAGYLWDCLKTYTVIKENEVFDFLYHCPNSVYVFWDINSKDRIFIKDYWRFDKGAMLEVTPKLLPDNYKYLPEDIYIFDDSFNWTYILTHEDKDGGRLCAKSEAI